MNSKLHLWLSDDQGDQVHAFRVRRVLHSGRTAYAQAEVVDTYAYGKMLALDGQAQSAAADEAAYHETLVAPAFVLSAQPLRSVAILGGGEGATLREVLRFTEVERCVMVDIDAELVDLCRRSMPEWSAGAFEDPRAALHFGDARSFLEHALRAGDRYDLILCDLPEAEVGGPLQRLYSRAFFDLARRCLTLTGLCAGQIGSLQTPPSVLGPSRILATAALGGSAQVYARFIPSYWGEWLFTILGPGLTGDPATLSPAHIDEQLARRRSSSWPCATYDGLTHQRLFALPKDLRHALAGGAWIDDPRG